MSALYYELAGDLWSPNQRIELDLDGLVHQPFVNTKVQTRFSFSDKRYSRMTFWGVNDEAGLDGSSPHECLLGSLP